MSVVARFEITYTQFLHPSGKCAEPLPKGLDSKVWLTDIYKRLLFARLFDQKAIYLQRTGKMGTYASSLGQEAIGVGIGEALEPSDVFVPSYRDYPALFRRGVCPSEVLRYWGGDERGSCFAVGGSDFPLCVPIGSQCLHAAGIAFALQYRQEKRAVVVTCGDGGTSQGDFYEALNVAGAWKLPVVFVVCNNGWAISIPRSHQTAAETLAQKGIAAGIASLQVDGNDIVAMTHTLKEALKRARHGKGPTLVEAMTYRLSDHTTADDATRYRDPKELKTAMEKEPLARVRSYLASKKWWNPKDEEAETARAQAEVDVCVSKYLANTKPPVTDMFDHLFETLPRILQEQRAEVFARSAHVGDDHA